MARSSSTRSHGTAVMYGIFWVMNKNITFLTPTPFTDENLKSTAQVISHESAHAVALSEFP